MPTRSTQSEPQPHAARIAKIYEGTHPQALPYEPIVASGGIWARLRLEEIRSGPGEEPDATPTENDVVLNLGAPFRREVAWTDEQSAHSSTLLTGASAILPAHERYRSRWFDQFHVIVLAVDCSLISEAAGLAGHLNPEHVHLRRELCCDDPLLRYLILALREALQTDERDSGLYGESLAVATHLASRYVATTRAAAGTGTLLPMQRMRRVAEYVQTHLGATISLQELGNVAKMSVFHFSRLFKARTGVTPHQYVLRRASPVPGRCWPTPRSPLPGSRRSAASRTSNILRTCSAATWAKPRLPIASATLCEGLDSA